MASTLGIRTRPAHPTRLGYAVRATTTATIAFRRIPALAGASYRGASNPASDAPTLYISPATARTCVSRILTKLGARDRTELAVLAHRAGLYQEDDDAPGTGQGKTSSS